MKTTAELDADINRFIAAHHGKRRGRTTTTRNARLVVLDEDGVARGSANLKRLKEYVERDSVDGKRGYSIGIRYLDEDDNDVAEALTVAEARALLPLLR